jgi:hypothetical protein
MLSIRVSERCEVSEKARQMRLTSVWLMPTASAIVHVDQWVVALGLDSRVRVSIRTLPQIG